MKRSRYQSFVAVFLVGLLSVCSLTVAQHVVKPSVAPKGAINGLFSVSEDEQVYFSEGNLQFIGSAREPYWRFAENQWDCLGIANNQDNTVQDVDRDLFEWEMADRGSKQIRNGGDPTLSGWRLLTQQEWLFVFYTRNTSSGIRFAKAQVNGVNGVVLLPDDWNRSYYRLKSTNQPKASYASNVISADLWGTLEQYGAVFLPAAGCRIGKQVVNLGSHGDYWSSTSAENNRAGYVYFKDNRLYAHRNIYSDFGQSVRLVHANHGDLYELNTVSNPVNGGGTEGEGVYEFNTRCTITAIPLEGYAFVNWTEQGVVVSTEAVYSFFVSCNRSLVANFISLASGIEEGTISGVFSVGACRQVQFSQGNLQYVEWFSNPYWKFAEHQWDCLGYQGEVGVFKTTVCDLFGWGTSGYHDQHDPCNREYQPSSTTILSNVDFNNIYGYGPSANMASPNLTGSSANYDWGVYNPIVNGGGRAGIWRTLTYEEWSYVLFSRETDSGIRFAMANVNHVNGVILLPDDWKEEFCHLTDANATDANFSSNVIVENQWDILEQYGAVFLPTAGFRIAMREDAVGSSGNYWTASSSGGGYAWYVDFYDGNISIHKGERYYGQSVRLVRDVQ